MPGSLWKLHGGWGGLVSYERGTPVDAPRIRLSVQGLGFGVQGSGSRVQGLGFEVYGSGLGLGCGVWSWSLGLRDQGLVVHRLWCFF